MSEASDGLCPAEPLARVLEVLRGDDEAGLAVIAQLLDSYPLDPRLHFLQGSVMAGLQRYGEGRAAMARAVEIAPDFALARFQVGFLDLTSGRAMDAVRVWSPLANLPEDDPLQVFAAGLTYLAGDNFSEARRLLQKGIALNTQNPVMNADMQLILDEIDGMSDKPSDPGPGAPESDEPAPASAVDQLLKQSRLRGGSGRKH
jgi:Flp pilus assembly protein TadD